MFVDREWLEAELALGKSFEQIGRELERDGSTIAWWARRFGLRSDGSERFSARGAPDRELLQRLAASGATLAELGAAVDRSIATVRYWLKRWEIERGPRPGRTPTDPETAPRLTVMRCKRHGLTEFCLEGRGSYRCKRCRSDRVAERRRRVKQTLVAEAGGRCSACGYAECLAALQFHHVDPAQKSFALSLNGVARNLSLLRKEAKKCILLCANCHAEVENGYRALESAPQA
jgi:transposase-like protein